MSFEKAADIYLSTQGNTAFIKEALSISKIKIPPDKLQNLRVQQATLQLELRNLSEGARHALEKLSIHPNHLPEDFIKIFEADVYFDELERQGWLSFNNSWQSWQVSQEYLRKFLYNNLMSGQRVRYHSLASKFFADRENFFAEAYHSSRAKKEIDWSKLVKELEDWQLLVLKGKLNKTSFASFMPYLEGIVPTNYTVGRRIKSIEFTSRDIAFNSCQPSYGKSYCKGNDYTYISVFRQPLQDIGSSTLTCGLPSTPLLLNLQGNNKS